MRFVFLPIAFLFAAPALAQDAARPEAMISFFAKETPQRASRVVAGHGGHLVKSSWYGGRERLNSHTASGARFRPSGLTAAHRSLPFGTRLHLSYRGRSVVAVVNDRGPAAYTGRSLDVSRGVASSLGFLSQGVVHLRMEVMR